MSPGLTTHVLDTSRGRPAAGLRIDLSRIEPDGRTHLLKTVTTNADGRCDAPLLADALFVPGTYELDFAVGDYFAGLGVVQPVPRFLDVVTLRVGVADASANHHVPLLVSPYGYSTYRGS